MSHGSHGDLKYQHAQPAFEMLQIAAMVVQKISMINPHLICCNTPEAA
jgi:hypothetical protein